MAEAASHPWLTDDGPPFLLGVGRLAPQKDFKTLLSAFSIVARVRDVRLLLLGEGPQQAELGGAGRIARHQRPRGHARLPAQPLPFHAESRRIGDVLDL